MKVFKQLPPEPTGQTFTSRDSNGDVHYLEWHKARFQFMGNVKTWEEAKRLTPAPVVEGFVR
jgi:hypothetical protein